MKAHQLIFTAYFFVIFLALFGASLALVAGAVKFLVLDLGGEFLGYMFS